MTHKFSSAQMTQSQEEFSIHLSQAINYLHSHQRRIKTWAALFIGGQHGPGLESSFTLPTHKAGGEEGLGLSSLHPVAMALLPSFTGYTTCYQPQAMSQMINDMDTELLFSSKWPTPLASLHTCQLPEACHLRWWHRQEPRPPEQTTPHQGTPRWPMGGKRPLSLLPIWNWNGSWRVASGPG